MAAASACSSLPRLNEKTEYDSAGSYCPRCDWVQISDALCPNPLFVPSCHGTADLQHPHRETHATPPVPSAHLNSNIASELARMLVFNADHMLCLSDASLRTT